MSDGGAPPTTTISTIAVQSGDARIVIALLQSAEWIQLKVLEMSPQLTLLGENTVSASEMQVAHEDMLRKLQSKQSPVEEVLKQADQLISSQRPRAEVYAAMADSLGLAWKDLNHQLMRRRELLNRNVAFHNRADLFYDRIVACEKELCNQTLPVDTNLVRHLLNKLHDYRKSILESLMAAHQEGQTLLDDLRELEKDGTIDSRPGHIRPAVETACCQVETWLEALHDRRKSMEIVWNSRKFDLEQCLALCLLYHDLDDVDQWIHTRGRDNLRVDQLGESVISAEILLHEHGAVENETKETQERCIRLVKTAEQLRNNGHYAGEEATTKAYTVLEMVAQYCSMVQKRRSILTCAITFFKNVQMAFTKMAQLEAEATNSDVAGSQLMQLHSEVERKLDQVCQPVIDEGHQLIETAEKVGTTGVVKAIEELKKRKAHVASLCTANKEENIRRSQQGAVYLESLRAFENWLVSMGEAFLQGHQDMGTVLAMAKDFQKMHQNLQNEIMVKGSELEALTTAMPSVQEMLDRESAEELRVKVNALHEQWQNLRKAVGERIQISTTYVRFHTLAVELARNMDSLEENLRASAALSDPVAAEETWMSIKQLHLQLKNKGKHFEDDSKKAWDQFIDIKRALLCVNTLLEHFANRENVLQQMWDNLKAGEQTNRELKQEWTRIVQQTTKTLEYVLRIDLSLYPLLAGGGHTIPEVYDYLEKRAAPATETLNKAMQEINSRIGSCEMTAAKGDTGGQKEEIVGQLQGAQQKLQRWNTEYTSLVNIAKSYLNSLKELSKLTERLRRPLSSLLSDEVSIAQAQLRDHEETKHAHQQLFQFARDEADSIKKAVMQQEPFDCAQQDCQKIEDLLNTQHTEWCISWDSRYQILHRQVNMCQFNGDLHQINKQLNELSDQLHSLRGNYGDSLASATNTSNAFMRFEKTIELLESRIQTFINTAEAMIREDPEIAPQIQSELDQLQTKWSSFHRDVVASRKLIDLSVQFFRLVEEAQGWCKEGSGILVNVARRSTEVKHPEEAQSLLSTVQAFLNPGEMIQQERLNKISMLAMQIYGDKEPAHVSSVNQQNREMMSSFSSIHMELTTLMTSLREAEAAKHKAELERMQAEASLAAAKAEADLANKEAEEAKKRAQQASRERAEEEAKRAAEEAARKRAEREARLAEQEAARKKAEEEAARFRAEEEAKKAAQAAAKRRSEEEARMVAEEEAFRKRVEEETKRAAEDSARKRAAIEEARRAAYEESARIRAEEEAKRAAEEAARKREQEEARRAAAEEAKRIKAEEEAIRAAEKAARKKLEEEERITSSLVSSRVVIQKELIQVESSLAAAKAETELANREAEEARRKASEAARERAEEEAKRAAEEAARKRAEREARIAEQEAAKRKQEEEEARRRAEEEAQRASEAAARRRAEEDARRIAELEAFKLRAEEEAKRAAEESARKRAAIEEARRAAYEEASRIRAEEEAKRAAEEATRKREEAEARRMAAEEAARIKAEEDARRAAEQAARKKIEQEDRRSYMITSSSQVTTHKRTITNQEAIPLPPEKQLPPTPTPPKRPKFIEEAPRPIAPQFTLKLHDAEVEEGVRYIFECRVVGVPVPEVTWSKDGISIENNLDYVVKFENGICTLTIEETFTEDSALFTCKARNSAGHDETSASLKVKESEPLEELLPPSFVKKLVESTAQEGEAFQFECEVTGNPLPLVQWYKGDNCIDTSPDYVITYNNGLCLLRFEEVIIEDGAEYTCKAANPLGTDQCSAKLTVKTLTPTEAPGFIVPLSNIMARAGQKLRMECKVKGLPTPSISWFHNNRAVKETREVKMQYDGERSVLVIHEAYPKDAGTYVVKAKNSAGEATSSCNVSVKGRLPVESSDSEVVSDMEPVKPVVQLPLVDKLGTEGDKIRLDCIIVGQPEPEVIWYQNGVPVKESSDFKLEFHGDRCSLLIREAFPEDSGEYTVAAMNSAGECTSTCKVTILPIEEEVKFPSIQEKERASPPKFLSLLKDVTSKEGDNITFQCQVIGDPRPTITWQKDEKPLHASIKRQLLEQEDGTVKLCINGAVKQDSGVYTVRASNKIGDAKCYASLAVQQQDIPPNFTKLFKDVTVKQSEPIKFDCVITGAPIPKVQWLFNGEPAEAHGFLSSSKLNHYELYLATAALHHKGKVACVADNAAGKATCVADITVQGLSMQPVAPAAATMSVKKTSFMESSEVTRTMMGTEIHRVEAHRDQAMTQMAGQPAHKVEAQKVLDFQQKDREEPVIKESTHFVREVASASPIPRLQPPKFSRPFTPLVVQEGQKVMFRGELSGIPEPSVHWTKDEKELVLRGDVHLSYTGGEVSLVIGKATEGDSGRYSCQARNPAGTATSTVDLVVQMRQTPPMFLKQLQAQAVSPGERLLLDVEVEGTPTPQVTWYKDDHLISSLHKYSINTEGTRHYLTIPKVSHEDSGKYMVKLKNPAGEAKCIADVAVREHPQQQITAKKFEEKRLAFLEKRRTEKHHDTKREDRLKRTPEPHVASPRPEKPIELEPFPFKPEPEVPKDVRPKVPPPSKLFKFVPKGESPPKQTEPDVKIVPVWRPGDSDTEDMPSFKKVRPPTASPKHTPDTSYEESQPIPPSAFEKPIEMPTKAIVDLSHVADGQVSMSFETKQQVSHQTKVTKVSKSFETKKASYVSPKPMLPLYQESDIMLPEPGPEPEFGYVTPSEAEPSLVRRGSVKAIRKQLEKQAEAPSAGKPADKIPGAVPVMSPIIRSEPFQFQIDQSRQSPVSRSDDSRSVTLDIAFESDRSTADDSFKLETSQEEFISFGGFKTHIDVKQGIAHTIDPSKHKPSEEGIRMEKEWVPKKKEAGAWPPPSHDERAPSPWKDGRIVPWTSEGQRPPSRSESPYVVSSKLKDELTSLISEIEKESEACGGISVQKSSQEFSAVSKTKTVTKEHATLERKEIITHEGLEYHSGFSSEEKSGLFSEAEKRTSMPASIKVIPSSTATSEIPEVAPPPASVSQLKRIFEEDGKASSSTFLSGKPEKEFPMETPVQKKTVDDKASAMDALDKLWSLPEPEPGAVVVDMSDRVAATYQLTSPQQDRNAVVPSPVLSRDTQAIPPQASQVLGITGTSELAPSEIESVERIVPLTAELGEEAGIVEERVQKLSVETKQAPLNEPTSDLYKEVFLEAEKTGKKYPSPPKTFTAVKFKVQPYVPPPMPYELTDKPIEEPQICPVKVDRKVTKLPVQQQLEETRVVEERIQKTSFEAAHAGKRSPIPPKVASAVTFKVKPYTPPSEEPHIRPVKMDHQVAKLPSQIPHYQQNLDVEQTQVTRLHEATDTSRRYVVTEKTTRVMQLGQQKDSFTKLEPFPFKPEPEAPKATTKVPPPPMPSKFIPKPPSPDKVEDDTTFSSDTEELKFRRVKAPQSPGPRRKIITPEPPAPSEFEVPMPTEHRISRSPLTKTTTAKKISSEVTSIRKDVRIEQRSSQSRIPRPVSPPGKVQMKAAEAPDVHMVDHYRKFGKQEIRRSGSLPRMPLSSPLLVKKYSDPTRYTPQDVPSSPEPSKYKVQPPPSPSKFIPKQPSPESSYSTDDIKIPAKWTPSGEVEELHYHSVQVDMSKGRMSAPLFREVEPEPPSKFDKIPSFKGQMRPTFQPITKAYPRESSPVIEVPRPIPGKIISKVKAPAIRAKSPEPKPKRIPTPPIEPGTPPEVYVAPKPKHKSKSQQEEEVNLLERYEVMREEERHAQVISAPSAPPKVPSPTSAFTPFPELEPFPFTPEGGKQTRKQKVPPPPSPKKFVPGISTEEEYREDTSPIPSKWSHTPEPEHLISYRMVKAPETKQTGSYVEEMKQPTPPMEFEEPLKMTGSPRPKVEFPPDEPDTATMASQYTKVADIKKMFDSREPAVPPEYGYVGRKETTTATRVIQNNFDTMSQTFRTKAQKFAEQIVEEMHTPKEGSVAKSVSRENSLPAEKAVPAEAAQVAVNGQEPQAYREESRTVDFGTKHIDPDTGLIYFKYDFGYEFGIVTPGEAKKVDPKSQRKQSGDIEVPVIRERSDDPQQRSTSVPPQLNGDVLSRSRPSRTSESEKEVSESEPERARKRRKDIPQFKPKRFQFKPNKWEPTSESEMSESEIELSNFSFPKRSASAGPPIKPPNIIGGRRSSTPKEEAAAIVGAVVKEEMHLHEQGKHAMEHFRGASPGPASYTGGVGSF